MIEKLFHRIKTGFNRPASARTDVLFEERCAEVYRILNQYDDDVLMEVNDRFIELYTKKSMPAPIDVERICEIVKVDHARKARIQSYERKQSRKNQQGSWNDAFAMSNLHHHGRRALNEGWHAEYYAFLARHSRQPTETEITGAIIPDKDKRRQGWLKLGPEARETVETAHASRSKHVANLIETSAKETLL